jgi:SAM-dependent methyltransferase
MSETHQQRVHDAFTAQARSFEDKRFNGVFTDESSWLFQQLACDPQDVLLDVAAGTGHTARSLAPRVRLAVAVDVTEAMLATGQSATRSDGPENVMFVRGDAAALPFLDASFDIVVTRFALHHVEDPAAVVREMARCARPGAHVAIGDLVADEDRALAVSQNRLERLRDPSHTHALPVHEIELLCTAAGLEVLSSEVRSTQLPLTRWLEQAQTPVEVADGIRAQLRGELDGGQRTGFEPRERDGEVRFRQRWASVIARKPGR